jgi:hypothetical protein
MAMRQVSTAVLCCLLLTCTTLASSAFAQTSPAQTSPSGQAESTRSATATVASAEQVEPPGSLVGVVVSVSRQTMVVRTEDNRFHLFVFDNDTVRPKGLTPGAHIRVVSNSTDESGVRLATSIAVLDTEAAPEMARPPKEIREAQHEIERLARRWQVGVRIGAGLDPELFLIGAHSAIGPIFSRDFYFRPNVEFAFGELTDMVAINLEGAYRLPITLRQGRWSAYAGAGTGLNFVHQGVDKSDVSFSNFEYQTGLNVFSGVRFRNGTSAEVKASLWATGVPTLRLILGYTF